MFVIAHYDYFGIGDSSYVNELTWKKKIFCAKEYANGKLMQFCRDIDLPRNSQIAWKHWERTGEIIEFAGKKMVVKTIELKGFAANLFRLGTGVQIWNNAHHAKADGIAVLKPVALIEERAWNQTRTSIIYLYEGEVCTKENVAKIEILQKFLFQKRVAHHDFYLRNIVELEDGTLQLIDIDKMHWYPKYSYLFILKMRDENRKFQKEIR